MAEIDGSPVKKLGTSLLNNDPAILSVEIPERIAHLDGSVCAWNKNLKRAQLANSLLVIEDACLSCNPVMTGITIPPAVCWVGLDFWGVINNAELCFFPAENGFDLNFFNSMLMRFEPSER